MRLANKSNAVYKKHMKNAIYSDFAVTPPTQKSINANRQCPKSTNKKAGHGRHPTIDSNLGKYQFLEDKNITLLKSMMRKSVQNTVSDRESTQDKVMESSLYKKLLLEFQNTKKNYNKEINGLKEEIKELGELIVTQKQALLGLIHKRNKMEADVSKATNQLIELQQGNYERYWDVAARINQEDEDYEQLLELENQMGSVSRGLPIQQLQKLIKKCQSKSKAPTTNPQETPQSCCICCQNIDENELICKLTCGHTHHSECIREWLGINKVCPLCRKDVLS